MWCGGTRLRLSAPAAGEAHGGLGLSGCDEGRGGGGGEGGGKAAPGESGGDGAAKARRAVAKAVSQGWQDQLEASEAGIGVGIGNEREEEAQAWRYGIIWRGGGKGMEGGGKQAMMIRAAQPSTSSATPTHWRQL